MRRKKRLPYVQNPDYDRHIRHFNESPFPVTPKGLLKFLECHRDRPPTAKQAKYALRRSIERSMTPRARKLLDALQLFRVRISKSKVRPEDLLTMDELFRFVQNVRPRKLAPLALCLHYSAGRIQSILDTELRNCYPDSARKRAIFYSYDGKVKKNLDYEIPLWLFGAIRSRFKGQKFLFENAPGKALPYNYVQKRMKSEGMRILRRRVHSHLFRHTVASHLVGSGVLLHEVSQLLHHAQTSTTSDYYVHLRPNADKIISLLEEDNLKLALKAQVKNDHDAIRAQARGILANSNSDTNGGPSRRSRRTGENSAKTGPREATPQNKARTATAKAAGI